MHPAVAVIVLHWNRVADTLACLESLERLDYPDYAVVVVDNGSRDGSVRTLAARHPGVPILEAGQNLGYTGGNNLGIRYALDRGAEYVWLLNDDATVAADALSALVSAALRAPGAGFLGLKVYTREEPGVILSAGMELDQNWRPSHRGLGQVDHGQFDAATDVDCLSGCALLVARRAIEAVGALDDDFFAYGEDVEWCVRGGKAGFSSLFVPRARAWHPDTRQRDRDSAPVTYYSARNHLLFLRKHGPSRVLLLRQLAKYAVLLANWSSNPKWRPIRRKRNALWWAVSDFALGRLGPARRPL